MGDLSEQLGEFESVLEKLKIRRIVHSLKITSFENISEQFTITYENRDNCEHTILPLPLKRRVTQRSMKVYDRSNNELIIFPSYKIHAAFRKLSMYYLDTITIYVCGAKHENEFEERITELRQYLRNIFRCGNIEEEIQSTNKILRYLSQCFESLTSQNKEECKGLLSKLAYLVNLQKHYVPFVELKEPFCQRKYCAVLYKVETPESFEKKKKNLLLDRLLFYIRGEMNLPFSLRPASVPSYHLEIIPPKGVDICDFTFDGLGDKKEDIMKSKIRRKEKEKNRYFDKELLYITFSPEETKEIRSKIYEEETPAVTLNLKINSLLRCLYYLVYVAVLSPLIIKGVHGHVDLSDFVASLGLAATIYVSASIYAIDKKIVQKFALFHLFTTIVLLSIEIVALSWLF